MRRNLLLALAATLAIVAASLMIYTWGSAPTTLRVAVGPLASEDTRLLTAISQQLNQDRASVRLKLVLTEGAAASAESLNQGKADLAVVRTDVAMPMKGQTVLVLHRDAAVLTAVEASGLSKLSEIKGRTIGLFRGPDSNRKLLESILDHYEIPRDGVTVVPLRSAAEAEEALREQRIDAIFAVGTPTGRVLTEAVAATARAAATAPVFIPIGEADALSQRSPAFSSYEVVRGSFGGTPSRPAEPFTTLGVSHRLVAHARLDDGVIAELTRLLFQMRPAISGSVPLANRIEAPDTAKGSSLPVHPGAASYYDGEVQSFFDRWGDWFYLGIMVVSIFGSLAAAVASKSANRNRLRQMALLNRLLDIIHEARISHHEPELDRLEAETDDILGQALSKAGQGDIDQAGMVAFFLGVDQVRRAILERRRWLVENAHPLAQAAE